METIQAIVGLLAHEIDDIGKPRMLTESVDPSFSHAVVTLQLCRHVRSGNREEESGTHKTHRELERCRWRGCRASYTTSWPLQQG
jgi:hypothetical protein